MYRTTEQASDFPFDIFVHLVSRNSEQFKHMHLLHVSRYETLQKKQKNVHLVSRTTGQDKPLEMYIWCIEQLHKQSI
jgi:hypothetical protein